jgi:methionyl-tRNA synthetase
MITIDDFKKVEIKIGEILSAEAVAGSDKLIKLSVDFGSKLPLVESSVEADIRQVLSGIAAYFPDPQSLVGKRCAFVANLEPRMIMGMESQAMILAVTSEESIILFEVPDFVAPGTLVK